SLSTGEHKLVMKRGDQVLGSWRFSVGTGDSDIELKTDREVPPRNPSTTPTSKASTAPAPKSGSPADPPLPVARSQELAPELNDVVLPFQAAWDTRALRRYFTVGTASYDSETKKLSWLVESKRGFRSRLWQEIKIDVNFVDAGGIRVYQHSTTGGGFG